MYTSYNNSSKDREEVSSINNLWWSNDNQRRNEREREREYVYEREREIERITNVQFAVCLHCFVFSIYVYTRVLLGYFIICIIIYICT